MVENYNSKWPKLRKEQLVVGNSKSNVGICTLWTPAEIIIKDISKDKYLIAGQCYSPQEGVNLIIRNCLMNKKLKYLVICGKDLSLSGEVLLKLSENGIDENNQVKDCETECIIESEISRDAIERFRKNVKFYDYRDKSNEELKEFFNQEFLNEEAWGEPEVFEKSVPKPPLTYPSENACFIVRGRTIGETWLKILDTILKFGNIKKSQYDNSQQELINLTTVLTEEDIKNIKWEPYFIFSKKHFFEYLPQLMSSYPIYGVEYTYGQRLRNFRGINQIDSIVKQLKEASYSRRAVGVLWDICKDFNNPKSPCLNLVHALIKDEKLVMTAFFRSNDMFKAWPENALALRHMQYEIANRVGVKVGDLITISSSSHIYSQDWEKAKSVVKDNLVLMRIPDPRGNILIELEDKKIKIGHLDVNGKRINEFYCDSSDEAYNKIVKMQMISQVSHALDIGGELKKAEYALKKGLKYVQDRELEIL
ncbi:hypothetical protein GOV12_02645 [Candidatus Pacearchaeota archaeon]|nr:hypothetical protein [Candidatus Pacearchaeota archaeon]